MQVLIVYPKFGFQNQNLNKMVKPIKGFKQATSPPVGIPAITIVSQSLSSHLLTQQWYSPPQPLPTEAVQGTTSSSIKSDYVSPPQPPVVSISSPPVVSFPSPPSPIPTSAVQGTTSSSIKSYYESPPQPPVVSPPSAP